MSVDVFSYEPSQLATSELMQVRFELHDVDGADPKLDDREILYALSVERNIWAATARCAEVIARLYLMKADVQLGRHLHVVYSNMAKQYLEMAQMLRRKALGTVAPWAGGLSTSDKAASEQNPDAVQPFFTRTMMGNPRVGGVSSDPVENVPR